MWWVLIVGGMSLLALYALGPDISQLTYTPWAPLLTVLQPVHTFALFVFRSRFVLQLVLYAACVAHVLEALVAFRLARAIGCSGTVGSAHYIYNY
jgi:hypothetical protein